ncbi:MAG: hypothetical protein A2158_08150 [Chloroflexi bacterium RBG_13_46_14]|nr:MAG: hypothetical protein A2158_08150 [Chloroflexi bacterium RBG_13_46_14]
MTDNKQPEREDNTVEKASFEQVPSTRAGDRVLRRRRKPRGLFPYIVRNIRKLIRGTGSR